MTPLNKQYFESVAECGERNVLSLCYLCVFCHARKILETNIKVQKQKCKNRKILETNIKYIS